MKKMIRSLAALTALALLGAGLIACSSDDGDGGDSVKVTPSLDKNITLKAGESGTYTVTFTVEGDTFKEPTVTEPVKLEDKSNKVTITELDMVAGSFTETSVKYTFKVTAKDDATVGKGKIAVTADASVFTGGKDYTGELDYTIEGESGEFTGWTWTVADYVKSASTTSFGVETECGHVTAGKNVKERNDGDGISGTISAGVTGYFQLSNGADGSVWFTAPAGTKKIIVCAKLDAATKQIVLKTNATSSTNSTELGKATGASGDNYKDHTFDVDITEDTVIYVGTFASSVSANLKAIKISD